MGVEDVSPGVRVIRVIGTCMGIIMKGSLRIIIIATIFVVIEPRCLVVNVSGLLYSFLRGLLDLLNNAQVLLRDTIVIFILKVITS